MNIIIKLLYNLKSAYNVKKNKLAWINIVLLIALFIVIGFAFRAGNNYFNKGGNGDLKKYSSAIMSSKDEKRKTEATSAAYSDKNLNGAQKFDFTTESVQRIALNDTMKEYLNNAIKNEGEMPTGLYYASGSLNVYIEDDLPKVIGMENQIQIGSDIQDGIVYVNGAGSTESKEIIRHAIEQVYKYSIAKVAYKNPLQIYFN